MELVVDFYDFLIIIDKILSNNEMKNLLRCCDCFIFLYCLEGFGLGLLEVMSLGKLIIVICYLGNVDFMNDINFCLVDYKFEFVGENCYFYW